MGIELCQQFQEAVVGCICGRLGMASEGGDLGFEPFGFGKSEAILFENIHVLGHPTYMYVYTVYCIKY